MGKSARFCRSTSNSIAQVGRIDSGPAGYIFIEYSIHSGFFKRGKDLDAIDIEKRMFFNNLWREVRCFYKRFYCIVYEFLLIFHVKESKMACISIEIAVC